jgi:hypothetical protein
MRLYHFTNPANFIRIAAEGLTPNVKPENALMSFGQPVVWLTTNESNEMTEADVAHLSIYAPNERRAVGDFNFGGSHRLTVNLSRTSKRLAHWSTWMRKHSRVIVAKKGAASANDAVELLSTDWILSRMPPDASNWYIHFGPIPPHKLELNLTRELALAGLEYQIEQTNYAGFVELRTQIAATEPGTIINPILEDGARAQFSRWR